MRRIALVVALLAAGLLALLTPACATAERAARPGPGEPAYPVWVVEHGWHAGVAVRQASLRAAGVAPAVWPERADFPRGGYVEVGWGEAGYYPDPDPGVGDALRAGLWPTASVLHVTGFVRPPPEAFPHREVLRLEVSAEGLRALARFVHDAHLRGGSGARAEPVREGLWDGSLFYPGAGRYHALRNCNTWVAAALRAAGLPVAPGGALTVGALMRQLRPLAEEPPPPGAPSPGAP